MSFARGIAAMVAAAVVAGCAGSQVAVPTASAPRPASRHASLRIVIRIPRHRSHRGHFISPATQAMTVAITGPVSVSEVVGLTPTSNGCSSTLATTTCTLAVGGLTPCAAFNCYTATIFTYDAISCTTTCTIPGSANVLSAAQNVPFTVVTGQNNFVNFTLGGYPARIVATPLNPGYLQGDAARLRLWGPATQKLSIVALDADGNAIVGPGAPAVSATTSSSTLIVTPPASPSPNTIALTAQASGSPAAVTPGQVNLSITVTPPSQSGAGPMTRTVPVAIAHSAVYAGLSGNAIEVYYDGNTSSANLTISGTNTDLNDIYQLAVDASGNLFVAQGVPNGEILEFPAGANGNVAPAVTITGASTTLEAEGVALGTSGSLYVSNSTNAIAEFGLGASGNVAPAVTISGAGTGLNAPLGMALDSAGRLYVANYNGNNVLEFSAGSSGDATPAASLTGAPAFLRPQSVAFDASGNLYVIDGVASISKFAPGASGAAEPLARILPTGAYGYSVAIDAAGNVFAGSGTDVLEYAPIANGATGSPTPVARFPVSSGVYGLSVVPAPETNVVTP